MLSQTDEMDHTHIQTHKQEREEAVHLLHIDQVLQTDPDWSSGIVLEVSFLNSEKTIPIFYLVDLTCIKYPVD